jgi:SAM-dependent methyltransferase
MLRHKLKHAIYTWRTAKSLRGLFQRECPVCMFKGWFLPAGTPPRVDARCPKCWSLERHRLLKLWLNSAPNSVKGRVLHFAPEPAVADFIQPLATQYVSADLKQGEADIALNIEKTGLPSASFDCVVCSHVLEHVDDKAALAEIGRILAPSGIAILMVPIVEGWEKTFEDTALSTPAARRLFYGQADHIRFYGRDFRDRVLSAGFSLSEFTAAEPNVSRYSLCRGEKVFVARKPPIRGVQVDAPSI